VFAGSCQFDRCALAGFYNLIGKSGVWSVNRASCKVPANKETIAGSAAWSGFGSSVSIDLRPEIEEAPARSGVISRRDIIAKLSRIEDLPEWPEAIYLAVHHTDVVYTIETPKPFRSRHASRPISRRSRR